MKFGLHHIARLVTAIAALTAAMAVGAHAQLLPNLDGGSDADSVTVSLITYYPGSEIYELFGHTELRVATDGGSDLVFNYGTFDFNAPNFALRFATGKTDYMCVAMPSGRAPFTPGRKAVEQRLNLTQQQARDMRDRLMRNIMPDMATYRYKYVSDNCATRPRDMIEDVCGGVQWPGLQQGATYRQMMRHYNRNYPWEQLGIDMALGCGLDTAITTRQQMFVPLVLMQAASRATIERDGRRVPLVTDTRVINPGGDNGLALPPTPWPLTPMAAALAMLLAAAAVSWAGWRRRKPLRWFGSIVWTAAGAAGCLVWFLTFVSTHEATSPNVNAVWLHPFYLVAAVAVWRRGGKLMPALCIAMLAAIAAAAVCFATGMQEPNAAFIPLMATLAIMAATPLATGTAGNRKGNSKTQPTPIKP